MLEGRRNRWPENCWPPDDDDRTKVEAAVPLEDAELGRSPSKGLPALLVCRRRPEVLYVPVFPPARAVSVSRFEEEAVPSMYDLEDKPLCMDGEELRIRWSYRSERVVETIA